MSDATDNLWAQGFSKGARLNNSLADYWNAPGGGPLHDEWTDKPHRLLYDLIGEVLHLRAEVTACEAAAAAAEVERLREALRFYACSCQPDGEDCGDAFDAVYCGRTARAALAGEGKSND